ncbi:antibiotic biosynthesis monooxygenase [Erysipelothrix rhusiopathiae]|uniref:ABM domain-containing protein n=2 Tax=Erysipelothrix TaxID=1647 RepID=E7FTP1_ERYRH|nr:antibiotic biosynthesis monooxygenase [Erysipelothrix rhusiopathiae]CAH2761598.1 antibiotic biosynthesis monooxygenase [Erysipelothrix sp. A18Y020d]AGN23684.1 antibiotic biosynthesis monooxygenase [Erysipelothrix rhusiopathiae SY1027]AMS11537.1 antibiotic biosynthesis monooxygenase [Erysipelothrix rhusiopathiae]AOO68036.1 antibiotic biosynthesis monooxygenase [Erysipelothrix rhusiopathiae]AWU41116.1 antibiotic biosynthesis monooxygenase [Erysipelothrix rhusiopathiae]
MKYVEVKHFEMKKGTGRDFAENFYNRTVVKDFPGFVSIRVGLNESCHSYDCVDVSFVWENEDAYTNFKRSDLHKEIHRTRKPNPNMIKHSSYRYDMIHED